ncbi:GNAT family N-acetyltransferase [Ralstonia pseudosolanacearum]
MSDVTIRPVTDADLPGVLAVQQACYGNALLEPAEALASRWARSPALCLVAVHGTQLVGYLLSHAWHAWAPPKLHVPLPPADATHADRVWFVHDMAIAPAGRGQRLGERLHAAAGAAARAQGLHRSCLVAVQGAEAFWRRLGYWPAGADAAQQQALHAVYGDDAQLMEQTVFARG